MLPFSERRLIGRGGNIYIYTGSSFLLKVLVLFDKKDVGKLEKSRTMGAPIF